MIDQAAFARALLDPALPPPADVCAWNGSDPATRLAVYRNNVMVSLLGVLADSFPVTRTLVGEAFFQAMGRCFVRASPPHSPVMAEYGAGFADFIARFEPAQGLPYLPDVARLEWLRLTALHAADAPPLSGAGLAARLADTADLAAARLHLHPSFAVLHSSYAMVSVWAAHQGAGELAAIDLDCAETAWVLCRELEVEVIPVEAAAGRFAAALIDGQPLGAAVEAAGGADCAFDLPAALAGLIRCGALIDLSHAGDTP
ncbi:DNA-binding domain-containing protein [Immundisolibacter cernigliae]|jgi:hypothetical protein|uniref:Putative DNA-binding domain-containing protein n=1 Tax=Immundisolibacter cernigliae TaxID=1810504 RepID=A0A1B1YVH8_9GAMM|nr:DNA-binding domain-containing protein [Immundisolibacter cernigliae]ANX04805.1 hypothetical protein PG2T_11930 [Immundisolibacter cernigliae]